MGPGKEPSGTPRSCTVATSQLRALTNADVATTATTSPSEPSGVRSSSKIRTIVLIPTATDAPSSRPGWNNVSSARVTRDPASEL